MKSLEIFLWNFGYECLQILSVFLLMTIIYVIKENVCKTLIKELVNK